MQKGESVLIIDTDVLIWHLRGNEKAKEFIRNSFPFNISVVTYIEIIQGMRDKKEMRRLLKQFAKWHVNIVQINQRYFHKGDDICRTVFPQQRNANGRCAYRSNLH